MADRGRGSRAWTTLNDTCHLFRGDTTQRTDEMRKTSETRKLRVITASIIDRNYPKASLTEKLTRCYIGYRSKGVYSVHNSTRRS